MRRRRVAAASALLAALAVLGCKKAPPPDEEAIEQTQTGTAKADAGAPLDHLAPGELAPGTYVALGFTLPRVLRVEKTVGTTVYARGQASTEALVEYVRARVHGGKIQALPDGGAIFSHVTVDDPKVQLSIRVDSDQLGARLEVEDVTPPPKEDLPNDEARWRAAGLTPDGRPIDKTQLK